jgi:ribonuclease P protein subunit POP4
MVAAKLVKAELTGAQLDVVQSSQPQLVGLSGIVVQETMKTVKIAVPTGSIKSVPKAGCVFGLRVCGRAVRIFGTHMCLRPAERAVRKFKGKATIEIRQ